MPLQRLFHRPHPQGRAGLHNCRQLMLPAAADELGDGRRMQQDLPGNISAVSSIAPALSQDSLQYHSQAAAHLFLFRAGIGSGLRLTACAAERV